MSGSHWGKAGNERDRDVIDHLLTCPRPTCQALCDADCRYCSECGSRILPNERELQEVRELAENWSTLPVDEDGWPLAAAHIRQSYGAGYMAGLQRRVDADADAALESPAHVVDRPGDRAGTADLRRNEDLLDDQGS